MSATSDYREVTVLLVEDDDLDAEAVARAFRKARIANRLVRVRDGAEALRRLRGESGGPSPSPVLVLLDLNLPKLNGIEFLGAMRADPELHQTVVFVLTTSSDDEDKAAAYDEHVAGYMVKSRVGEDFGKLIGLLDHYWRVVELPRDR